jgi:hypothetical protein
MQKGVYDVMKGLILSSGAVLFIVLNPMIATAGMQKQGKSAPAQTDAQNVNQNWQEFHSVAGKCKMKFPNAPEHISEKMNIPEEGYDLRYDAYISSTEKQAVFMLLIAQYPDFVDETYAQMSLEGFLNGILSHNPSNQLIFADLVLVNGREVLDFFIRTGSVYFKGRAMMVKNSLYLMAMECEMQHFDEVNFNLFINSFQLAK